jgi:hypothetical protein
MQAPHSRYVCPPLRLCTGTQVGAKKSQIPIHQLLVSGFLAGCYIGMGAYLACSIQGGIIGERAVKCDVTLQVHGPFCRLPLFASVSWREVTPACGFCRSASPSSNSVRRQSCTL